MYGIKIYVGSYVHSRNTRVLKELSIKAILCVKSKCRFRDEYLCEHIPISDFGDMDLIGGYKEEKSSSLSPSSKDKRTKNYLTPTRDSGGPPPLYRCAAFLSRCAGQGMNVLIHCSSGVNRATTVAVGLFMLLKHKTLKESFNMVRRCRPCMSPHERYFKQLQALDRRLHGGELSLTREQVGPSLQQIVRKSIEEDEEKENLQRPKSSALDLLRSDLEKKEKELQRLRDELASSSSSELLGHSRTTPFSSSSSSSKTPESKLVDDDASPTTKSSSTLAENTPRRVLAFSDDPSPISVPPKKSTASTPARQTARPSSTSTTQSGAACSCVLL